MPGSRRRAEVVAAATSLTCEREGRGRVTAMVGKDGRREECKLRTAVSAVSYCRVWAAFDNWKGVFR
jgi:hypothetical protein